MSYEEIDKAIRTNDIATLEEERKKNFELVDDSEVGEQAKRVLNYINYNLQLILVKEQQ